MDAHLIEFFITATDNIRVPKIFAAFGFRIDNLGRRYMPAMNIFIEDGNGMEITQQEISNKNGDH